MAEDSDADSVISGSFDFVADEKYRGVCSNPSVHFTPPNYEDEFMSQFSDSWIAYLAQLGVPSEIRSFYIQNPDLAYTSARGSGITPLGSFVTPLDWRLAGFRMGIVDYLLPANYLIVCPLFLGEGGKLARGSPVFCSGQEYVPFVSYTESAVVSFLQGVGFGQ